METAQIVDRADVMREWRDNLVEKLGSETLADAQIRYELQAADEMRARHANLRAELQQLNAGLVEHLHDTAAQLAPLREVADHLLAESNAAFARLERARIVREADSATKFRNRMSAIQEELSKPYSPVGPTWSNWKPAAKMDAHPVGSN